MASIRQYLDQLLSPAKYNPANYASLSLEELETMFRGIAKARGPSPESLAMYVFLDVFPEPLDGLSLDLDPLTGLDLRADLEADIAALDPWTDTEDIEVIQAWEEMEDIEDLLRT